MKYIFVFTHIYAMKGEDDTKAMQEITHTIFNTKASSM